MDLLEELKLRVLKMIRGLKHLSYEEWQEELGLFILEKKKLHMKCVEEVFWYLGKPTEKPERDF